FMHRQRFVTLTTSRKKTDWGRVFFGFGLITITILAVTALDYHFNPDNYVYQFQVTPFIILAIISLLMIPLQTSFEEYLFRGYLMQGIGVLTHNKNFAFVIIYIIISGIIYLSLRSEEHTSELQSRENLVC